MSKQTIVLRSVFIYLLSSLLGVVYLSSMALGLESGGNNVQGYAADRVYDYGTIVKLEAEGSKRVTVVSQADAKKMFGVTVDPKVLPVKLSDGSLENETQVAVAGTYDVLVSTQGGPIAAGDHVTLSSVNGIAMKASTEETTVFGRAAKSFDGKGVVFGTKTLTDPKTNITQTVSFGSIPVTIEIQPNPNVISTKVDVPEFLERTGQAIAEKEVSPVRVYLSFMITAVCLVAAIVVVYSGIRNSIISIGRNPLTKKSIFRALLEIVLTSFLILIIGLFAVYLLLKL